MEIYNPPKSNLQGTTNCVGLAFSVGDTSYLHRGLQLVLSQLSLKKNQLMFKPLGKLLII